MFFVKAKTLPKDLTSYDLLKSLAVILMIVDHVGSYIQPDQTWWKTASSSVPIWFFFVGYASSRNLTPPIWIGAGILVLAEIVLGGEIFALSILATIILARIVIDPIMKAATRNAEVLIIITFGLTLLWLPSRILFEYGTLAFVLAMYGWFVRHQNDSPEIKSTLRVFMAFTVVLFGASHFIVMDFTTLQASVFWLSMILIFVLTSTFESKTYPELTNKMPKILVWCLQIMGRYSLYLYVGHVVLFMIIAYFLGTKDYELFQWTWFHP